MVDLDQKTYTCPHYQRINKYYLLKRSGMVIKCKHILAVERWVEMDKQKTASQVAAVKMQKTVMEKKM